MAMSKHESPQTKQSRGVRPRTPITFFVRPKKVIQETPPRFAAPFGGSLDQTPTSGAAQLARSAARPRAQTMLAQPHRSFAPDRGGAQWIEKQN